MDLLEVEDQNEGLDSSEGVSGLNFWALIGIYSVEIVCALLFAIYRYANFSHARDTYFAKRKCTRTIIILGMFLWVT